VKYEPATIEVKAGDTVIWKNQDERDHTVVSDKKAPESFNSGRIAPDGSYKRTFKKAGKYAYHCDYHPRMKGTVIVKE
jgi:plastocyanin